MEMNNLVSDLLVIHAQVLTFLRFILPTRAQIRATRRWDIAQISPSKIPGPFPYEYPSMLNWCLCLCALSARTARVLLQGTRQWFVIILMSLTIQNTSTVVYPTCLKQTINRFT
jgi:hypothetical protein